MSTVTVPAVPVKPRKSLAPVQVLAHFVGGATRSDVIEGAAVLSLTDLSTGAETPYWCEALFQSPADGGKCVGFRLKKFNSSEVYDVPRTLDACTCADASYRPERPGGCKHQAALRQALPTVTRDDHAVPTVPALPCPGAAIAAA
jgi:hypothetical protein